MLHTASLPTDTPHNNGVVTQPAPVRDDITAQLWTLTPEVCRELLKNALPNRPLSKARVQALVEDIRAGKWVTNGESIILDEDLRLLDGQHRLAAIAEAGITLQAMVVVGVAPEAMATIDQGRRKSAADVLAIHGMPQPIQLAASARWLWRYLHHAMRSTRLGLRDYELPAFLAAHPGLQAALPWGRTVRAMLPQSCASMVYYVMATKDAARAKQFCHALATGQELTATDPAYVVRERLLKDKSPMSHTGMVGRAALVVLGWNCVRHGQACPPSLVWRGLGDKTVAFPEIL
jgi:hypothetical protein